MEGLVLAGPSLCYGDPGKENLLIRSREKVNAQLKTLDKVLG